MKPKWILQAGVFDENIEQLVNEIKLQNMSVEIVENDQFNINIKNTYSETECIVAYGSIRFIRHLNKKKWSPCAWANFKNFNCQTYYSYYGKYLLNNNYIMMPIFETIRLKDSIFKYFNNSEELFIRPDSSQKSFSGHTIKYTNWDNDIKYLINHYCSQESLVLISNIKNIKNEYRYIVHNGDIVSSCRYIKDGEFFVDNKTNIIADKLVKQVAMEPWQPEPIYVVDIGELENNEFHLMEINSLNCSGFYGCNLREIVTHVSLQAITEWNELYGR